MNEPRNERTFKLSSKKLRLFRTNKGWSQEKLASECKKPDNPAKTLTPRTIKHLEDGISYPFVSTAGAIAAALGVTLDALSDEGDAELARNEVILYSDYDMVSPIAIDAFGLLYDRVILPLTDFAAGEGAFAKELREACPVIGSLVSNTALLRKGNAPISCPLTDSDTAIAGSYDAFKSEFSKFVQQSGIDWQELCREGDLNRGFAAFHAFITKSLLESGARTQRPIVFWSGPGSGPSPREYHKIATVLEVELETFVVPRVVVRPERLDCIREAVRDCPARETYREMLVTFAKTIEAPMQAAKSTSERRAILIDELQRLKASYEAWLHELKVFIFDLDLVPGGPDSNLLYFAQRFIRFKAQSPEGPKYVSHSKVNGSEEQKAKVDALFSNEEFRQMVKEVTWQKHLFAIQTSLADTFPSASQ